jgi:hypothetical protein
MHVKLNLQISAVIGAMGLICGAWAGGVGAEDLPRPGFYSIHEVKHEKPGSTYTTQGYVVFKYVCPPCPEGSLCKPCMGENVVISEKNDPLSDYNGVGGTELILFAQHTEALRLGQKYYFVVSSKADAGSEHVEGGTWWQEGEAPPAIGPEGVSD